MTIGRREILTLSLGAAIVPGVAAAQGSIPVWPPAERFALWPGQAPGFPVRPPRLAPEITGIPGGYRDIWMRGTAIPDVGVFRPARPDGRAVLVIPGGGYGFVSLRGEGMDVAEVLAAQGITAFVLNYRLPGDGWADRADAPLADAQRAMRLIRAGAARYAIDAARLSVIGFSAGGHLAGSLATLADLRVYRSIDAADRLSARPASAGLIYAVSNMDAGRSNGGSRANLLGPNADPRMVERFAIERHLTGAPPLFLVHAEDDGTVPIVNTLDLDAAARRARVPVETHLFRRGGHGFGTRAPRSSPASLWPDLYVRWLAEAISRTTG